jgi:hypothetical protein
MDVDFDDSAWTSTTFTPIFTSAWTPKWVGTTTDQANYCRIHITPNC